MCVVVATCEGVWLCHDYMHTMYLSMVVPHMPHESPGSRSPEIRCMGIWCRDLPYMYMFIVFEIIVLMVALYCTM